MEKAALLQNQIRENSTDLNDFLKDLTRWEKKVKDEDRNLKTERSLESKIPPIRSKSKKQPKAKEITTDISDKHEKSEKVKEKPKRISSYDYDAWSKFNVDEACKSDSEKEDGDNDSEDDEEDEYDIEEIEKIQHQKSIQKAILEKEKGNQLFKEGKFEASINRYTSAITCDPENPVLYANRAMALLKTEKFAAAEQDCNVALQLDPSYSKAIARRGTARKKLKKYNEALVDFTCLFAMEPKNKQAVQEITDIKKLLHTTKSKDGELSEQGKPSQTSDTKKIINQRGRSNKPLKRVNITEIGLDECPSEKTERSVNIKEKKILSPVHNKKFIMPTTSFMFETEFRNLKNDTENFYKYFKEIPLSDYGKLFYQCIDTLISSFLYILEEYYIRDNVAYHLELSTFATIKRFDMAKMFLSNRYKEKVTFLINHLSTDLYRHPVDRELINDLKKKYC